MYSDCPVPPGSSRNSAELLQSGASHSSLRSLRRRGQLLRAYRDTYIHPETLGDAVAMARIALSALGAEAVVGRQSAANLHGLIRAPAVPVHVLAPHGSTVRPREFLRPHYEHFTEQDLCDLEGIRCTNTVRTVVDLARTLPSAGEGLAVVDRALHRSLCTHESLMAEAGRHAGLRGVVRARRLARLGDHRAESQMESHLRLVVLDGGLPAPQPNLWVDEAGARVDLALEPWKLALEFASREQHAEWDQVRADRERDRRLIEHGWLILHFTARDVLAHPDRVVAQIASVLRQRGWKG